MPVTMNSCCLKQCWIVLLISLALTPRNVTGQVAATGSESSFEGEHIRGTGDPEYLKLLDVSRRMLSPDPEFQNLSMLYIPDWNGFTEGPTWSAWWIQNSYGTTFCALPFLDEPYITFLRNSDDLWFSQMGDGNRAGAGDYVAPDGCLCDSALPGTIYYRQGDGRPDLHDWAVEFTAAGLLIQSELVLIDHDSFAAAAILPKLERCANFLDSRRDPKNDLMLAGPGANLLAPSYAGYKKSDGSYGRAYLTGLSITTIAALDRLIEVEQLAGRPKQAGMYRARRERLKKALPKLMTEEGYFIRSLDPDGTRHGVVGERKHGYFESAPNHDAIAFEVADEAQSRRIYSKIVSLPALRPHGLMLANAPSYDDMYEEPTGLWDYGTWVNGGHWSSSEARMILAYYRLGDYEAAKRSMQALLTFARRFRLDNPLTKQGSEVYQPNEPINLTYDAFGPPAAMLRGLFGYHYLADRLILTPHIPPDITELEQMDPVRFGRKRIYLHIIGKGTITAVDLNGTPWLKYDTQSVTLPYGSLPDIALIQVVRGEGSMPRSGVKRSASSSYLTEHPVQIPADLEELENLASPLRRAYARLVKADLYDTYEAAHVRLALEAISIVFTRRRLLEEGALAPLPDAAARMAASRAYLETSHRLLEGLKSIVAQDRASSDPIKKRIAACWETP